MRSFLVRCDFAVVGRRFRGSGGHQQRGETRTWVGPEPPYNKPIKAKFISIANGQVELSYTRR